ncbi:hypothetical protein MHBO_002832, partial [Bonamia ostreae]
EEIVFKIIVSDGNSFVRCVNKRCQVTEPSVKRNFFVYTNRTRHKEVFVQINDTAVTNAKTILIVDTAKLYSELFYDGLVFVKWFKEMPYYHIGAENEVYSAKFFENRNHRLCLMDARVDDNFLNIKETQRGFMDNITIHCKVGYLTTNYEDKSFVKCVNGLSVVDYPCHRYLDPDINMEVIFSLFATCAMVTLMLIRILSPCLCRKYSNSMYFY